MANSEKQRLADDAIEQWVSFQMALYDKQKYPNTEFNAFAAAVRRYLQAVGKDRLINREVASAVNGLVDSLKIDQERVPDAVLWEATRLECLLFSGYDPDFEGDEPPGL